MSGCGVPLGNQAKNESMRRDSPIVVGGVGGSGTRVLARILMDVGVFIGRDLNDPLDDLSFAALFLRPRWWSGAMDEPGHETIHQGLDLFTRITFGEPPRTPRDIAFLARASVDLNGRRNPRWKQKRFANLITRSDQLPDGAVHTGWGWKEPISHLFLAPLEEHFEGLKYIHLVRNGLDMAFSDNQQQLKDWGKYFDAPVPQSPEQVPRASLRYWATVNEQARERCLNMGPEQALMVRFEDLCTSPEDQISRVLDFIEVDVDQRTRSRLVAIPKLPASTGRHRNHSLSLFRSEDVEVVRVFGFDVAAAS